MQKDYNFGELLYNFRQKKRVNLDVVSKKCKIPFKYLEALESSDFLNLPKKKWKKYLKTYCNFLGIKFKDVYFKAKNDYKKTLFNKDRQKINFFKSWHKTVKKVIIFIVVAAVFIFLAYKVNQIFSPPSLVIIEPQDSLKTLDKELTVKGKSQKEVEMTINNNVIFVDANGDFEEQIDLQRGLNLITVTAKKKYSRQNQINLRVLLLEEAEN